MTPPLGVLILHGFTGSRATVAPVVPQAERLGLPWRLPQLRGHWTEPRDLVGVTYADMLGDALASFDELRGVVPRVAIVGLSVGGVLTLDIAQRRPNQVAALVVLAPALRYVNPLSRFSSLIARLVKDFAGDPHGGFSDASLAARAGNYTNFPTATFASIYRAGREVEARLPRITAPAQLIGARRDRVVQPVTAQIVHDRISSRTKELHWFERTGHEMLLDCEAEAVAERIGTFLQARMGTLV